MVTCTRSTEIAGVEVMIVSTGIEISTKPSSVQWSYGRRPDTNVLTVLYTMAIGLVQDGMR